MVADELSGPVSSRRVGSVTTSARRIMWTWSQAAWHRGSARESDAKRVEVLHSGVAHDGGDRRPGTELGCESRRRLRWRRLTFRQRDPPRVRAVATLRSRPPSRLVRSDRRYRLAETPVLPPVYSTTEPPRARRPFASAASIIASAIRSLILPVGFSLSSLTSMRAPLSSPTLRRRAETCCRCDRGCSRRLSRSLPATMRIASAAINAIIGSKHRDQRSPSSTCSSTSDQKPWRSPNAAASILLRSSRTRSMIVAASSSGSRLSQAGWNTAMDS